MLTLNNFDTQIDKAVVLKGKQYFSNKAIVWLKEAEDYIWQAEVEGTDSYQVEITINKDRNIRQFL